MMVKRGLGRGFDSLIATEVIENEFDVTASDDQNVSDIRGIKVSNIEPNPEQPRREFDEESLELLAASIKKHGLMQPIVVTAGKSGKYQIVAGERRWRASKLAGIDTIKAIVRTVSGQQKLELALIENLHREDLNPLETATAYLKLRDQFNMSLEDISSEMNGARSTAAISNTLRLLRLPDFAKTALAKGDISEGHARQILALDGDEGLQRELVEKITAGGWSVRKAEQYVVALKNGRKGVPDGKKKSAATESDFTKKLSKKLGGARVQQQITTA
ncbi:MAG: ParB/RepB/Spo0J family partition protein, partial [Candidatus Nomurabacteria bacterium]|nr:ParB/RepB/Spo0J family partition protein [Candidatus Nomurabacteria bacterium]